jgi:hypothetical protein
MSNREIVIGLHLYQPPRRAEHQELSSISTDPKNQDWTAIIARESYDPLAKSEAAKKVTMDAFGTLRCDLQRINPSTKEAINNNLKENGVADTFIHPILPDLSREDKEIVVAAGKEAIIKETGVQPPFIWVPETALDYETLEVLAENNYKGVICAPEQIHRFDGRNADDQPIKINLKSGKVIYALPFNRPISSAFAFQSKYNADYFYEDHIRPAFDNGRRTVIAYTDGETFGHHWKEGDKFLNYLVNNTLPERGVEPVTINSISLDNAIEGELYHRSAWSCPHGDLARWHGPCGCAPGGRWKTSYYRTFENFNNRITEVVKKELGLDYQNLVVNNFVTAFKNKGRKESPSDLMSLVSAKVSALSSRTSCATFFDNPGTSGKINVLYAVQAVAHLKDVGFLNEKAEEIGRQFYDEINQSLSEQYKNFMINDKELEILGVKH